MSDIRLVRVQLASGGIGSLSIDVACSIPWKIVVSGLRFHEREFQARDLFESLVDLRVELDKLDERLLCAGARRDVFPSGMSRSMGGGRMAYVTRLGEPATETVDIFDEAEPTMVGTVEQQRKFHERWIRSLVKKT